MLFRTFVVTNPFNTKEIETIEERGVWRLLTRDDPSYRHWGDNEGKKLDVMFTGNGTKAGISNPENLPACKEILIQAYDEGVANNIASLIQRGAQFSDNDPFIRTPNFQGSIKRPVEESEIEKSNEYTGLFTYQKNALFGCKVAKASWNHLSICYAIEKYFLSCELASIPNELTKPEYGQIFLNQYKEHYKHVKFASAFLLAYSVIEELGLEIRSSKNDTRWVPQGEIGKWNPKVKKEVEKRLLERGVDITDPFVWLFRGDDSGLINVPNLNLGTKTNLNSTGAIQDRKMHIVDALHQAGYIRNFFVAHKYNEIVGMMGPYDVYNVQQLARRLILSSIGMFDQKKE
jgi:hypothetical protein